LQWPAAAGTDGCSAPDSRRSSCCSSRVGIVTYRALLRGELLSLNAAVITAIVGAAVFVPLFALFVRVARSIDAAL
jgi:hypothetical protein